MEQLEDVQKAFPVGSMVRTTKGCRFQGPSGGEVVKYGTWRDYIGVWVRKAGTDKVRMYLAKNLVRTDDKDGE